jgi:F-type H+-transporting ATPase subunit alpha
MKKVSGTLKLDQAQFRELEAFAKFGSDLDAATKLTIDRGQKNLEILKQPQFSPIAVEEQAAIIYCATNGLLDGVAVKKVKAFQFEYLETLRTSYKDALTALKAGKLDETTTSTLKEVALDLAKKFA